MLRNLLLSVAFVGCATSPVAAYISDPAIPAIFYKIVEADRCGIRLGPKAREWMDSLLDKLQDPEYVKEVLKQRKSELAEDPISPVVVSSCVDLRAEFLAKGLLD